MGRDPRGLIAMAIVGMFQSTRPHGA
ncbi:hypothetical protein AvCA_31540 [Azotobacter vinelandii CA]|uniref:Uncharacterized protein n=2 Tax=Azotobacter vinelandii TaxID=354 RepID=C1DNW4_AZOVD|nr:hypothetical protein Avin_31540 [Azotobacter vinelandii DJ]AGK14720.1 hypothetical protein AvCA_31540 [Azotobacter vinelandii CA]AGK21123.1 hypothetical protein AvCA6_31540 [Azotobacter vinelandii CA6]